MKRLHAWKNTNRDWHSNFWGDTRPTLGWLEFHLTPAANIIDIYVKNPSANEVGRLTVGTVRLKTIKAAGIVFIAFKIGNKGGRWMDVPVHWNLLSNESKQAVQNKQRGYVRTLTFRLLNAVDKTVLSTRTIKFSKNQVEEMVNSFTDACTTQVNFITLDNTLRNMARHNSASEFYMKGFGKTKRT